MPGNFCLHEFQKRDIILWSRSLESTWMISLTFIPFPTVSPFTSLKNHILSQIVSYLVQPLTLLTFFYLLNLDSKKLSQQTWTCFSWLYSSVLMCKVLSHRQVLLHRSVKCFRHTKTFILNSRLILSIDFIQSV